MESWKVIIKIRALVASIGIYEQFPAESTCTYSITRLCTLYNYDWQ